MIKQALKAGKSSAGIRVDVDEAAFRPKWTTWLKKHEEVKDMN